MQHEDNKPWDNVLARLVGLGGALIPLVTGLDAKSGWSETDYRLLIEIVALTFIVIGYVLSSWALLETAFSPALFESKKERGHHSRLDGSLCLGASSWLCRCIADLLRHPVTARFPLDIFTSYLYRGFARHSYIPRRPHLAGRVAWL